MSDSSAEATLAYIIIARTWYGRKKAGQVVEFDWQWKLSPATAAYCTAEYTHPYGWYSLKRRSDGWYIVAHVGCSWDFATKFIAFDWIIEGSLGHDILHWLIRRGALPEVANGAIDEELVEIARVRGNAPSWRRWYVEKAVNLVNEKARTGSVIERKIIYMYGDAT